MCRTIPVLIGGILGSLLATAVASAQDSIAWSRSLPEAQQQAAQQQRLVLLHFWDDNCPPCRRVERDVFPDASVVRAVNSNYVPVKIKVREMPQLRRQYDVTSWPTDVITTAAGEEIFRAVTSQDASRYTALLDRVAASQRARVPDASTIASGAPSAVRTASAEASLPPDNGTFRPSTTPAAGMQPAGTTHSGYAPQQAEANRDTMHPGGAGDPRATAYGAQGPSYGGPGYGGADNAAPPAYAPAQSPATNPAPYASNQPPYGTSQPGYGASQPGYGASQPGYASNQPPYGTSQPGYGASQAPYGGGRQGGGVGPQSGAPQSPYAAPAGQYSAAPAAPYAPQMNGPAAPNMPQQGGGQMQRSDFAATPPRGYATEPSPPGRTSWDGPREDLGNANPNGSAAPGRSPQDAYGQGNFAPPTTPPANGSAAFAGSPQAAPPSPQATPFALDGHCPVTLVEREQWQRADPQWGAEHRGLIYLFANQAAQQQFLANPDRYSPVLSGYDPVRYAETGRLVPGRRQHGVSFEDRVYLFADEAALQRFWQSPQRYAAAAYQAMNGQGMPAGVRR